MLLCLVALSQQSGCYFKPVQKKKNQKKIACQKETRQRRTYDFLFNLFLCTISIYYIPHNYDVIPKAMPHAIPQTQSSFYPRRNFSQWKLMLKLTQSQLQDKYFSQALEFRNDDFCFPLKTIYFRRCSLFVLLASREKRSEHNDRTCFAAHRKALTGDRLYY